MEMKATDDCLLMRFYEKIFAYRKSSEWNRERMLRVSIPDTHIFMSRQKPAVLIPKSSPYKNNNLSRLANKQTCQKRTG